jgi:hypothetical protein
MPAIGNAMLVGYQLIAVIQEGLHDLDFPVASLGSYDYSAVSYVSWRPLINEPAYCVFVSKLHLPCDRDSSPEQTL